MKNKKIPLLALGMLALGAIGSIAYQTHASQMAQQITAQTTTIKAPTSGQVDSTIDQKDASGKDLETNDNNSISGTESESANDTDSSAQSEQGESGSNQIGE